MKGMTNQKVLKVPNHIVEDFSVRFDQYQT